MSFKKDIMEKIASTMVKMDKEEKKEFMEYVIHSMGKSFFGDLTKEEKVEIMSKALQDLVEKSGMKTSKEKQDLIVTITENLVDRFTGAMDPDEKGEVLSNIVTSTVKKIAPEIKASVSTAFKQFIESSPEITKSVKELFQDPDLKNLLKDFVRSLIVLLKDLLKNLAMEVFGYVKESGPDIMDFLIEAARAGVKALVTIGIELLRKAFDVLGELMHAGRTSLMQTREWAERVMDSEEFGAIRGTMEDIVGQQADKVKELMASGVNNIEDLSVKTEMPRSTIRKVLLQLWEKGEIELDNLSLTKPKGDPLAQ